MQVIRNSFPIHESALRRGVLPVALSWVLAAIAPAAPTLAASDARHFVIDPDSTVSYHVTAKLLSVFDEAITGTNSQVSGQVLALSDGQVQGMVTAATDGFHSGITGRDRHVAQLLGAPAAPLIRYELHRLEGWDPTRPAGTAFTVGQLEANHQRRDLRIPIRYEVKDGRLTIDGEAPLRFRDFGIDPPVLGVVLKRAPENLQIRVHLVATER